MLQAQLAAAAVQQETQERLRQAREALVNTREVLVSAVRPRTSPSCFPFSQRVTSTAAITPPMHACFDPYRQSWCRRFWPQRRPSYRRRRPRRLLAALKHTPRPPQEQGRWPAVVKKETKQARGRRL